MPVLFVKLQGSHLTPKWLTSVIELDFIQAFSAIAFEVSSAKCKHMDRDITYLFTCSNPMRLFFTQTLILNEIHEMLHASSLSGK